MHYQTISVILAAVLCFVQSLLVNSIVNENKIVPKKNYLAGGIFIIFASFFKESLFLTPASIALTFVIVCASRIFSLIRKEKSYSDVFDLGFLVAVATLFYFPSAIFILFAYIGLATVRPFNFREWTIIILGFLSPFLLIFTFYYWNDKTATLFSEIANIHSAGWMVSNKLVLADKLMIGVLAICASAFLVLLPNSLYSSLIQVRKFSNVLVVLIFLIVVALLLAHTISTSHFVLLALPMGIIASMVLMQIKRKLLSEFIYIILILLVLAGQFLPFLNLL